MPDPKMCAKRLSENDYEQLKKYLEGQKTFNDVSQGAKNVLTAITKSEVDRSFHEQEQLFEMKTKLVNDKYVLDLDAFDKFEIVVREELGKGGLFGHDYDTAYNVEKCTIT